MSIESELQEIIASIPHISPKRDYWFVRTFAGIYYDDFIKGNFIGIAYDEISLFDINNANKADKPAKFLTDNIKKKNDKDRTPAHSAKQLLKFVYQIKKGDIVIIPNHGSHVLSFGEVTDTATFQRKDFPKDNDNCPYDKRKKVRWIKHVTRHSLNVNLYKLFFSHHTITEAKTYASYIDSTLHSLFVKAGKAHLILDIQTTKGINAKDLFLMGLLILEETEAFGDYAGLDIRTDGVEVKINLESPGTMEWIYIGIGAITLSALLINALIGGEFEVKGPFFRFAHKSEGLLKKIADFITAIRKNDSEGLSDIQKLKILLTEMKAKQPEELARLLGAQPEQKALPETNENTENDVKKKED